MGDIVLVTGSTAIDQTGVYAGSFAEYQSRYPINALNTSFQLAEMKTGFGGCAPNITYGLHQLGVSAIPLSSAGRNFRDRYLPHLEQIGINVDYIAIDDEVEHCASCMMINDQGGNQIIGFYPGPGSPLRKLPSEIRECDQVALAILGPEAPDLTIKQARDLTVLGIPMVFDPGQVATEFGETEILEMLSLSQVLIVNDYEFSVLQANASLTAKEIIDQVPEVVVTHNDKGVEIHTATGMCHVDALPDVEVVDVTGCGDAFRAGYAYGILNDLAHDERGQLGCIMAMLNLQSPQTQNYKTSLTELLALQNAHYR